MYSRTLVFALALLVLLAGCTGGDGGDVSVTTADASVSTTQPPQDAADSTAEAPVEPERVETVWNRESFRTGQYYRYDVTYPDVYGTGTFEWEVLDATDDSATVRAVLDTDEMAYEGTVTAPPDEIYASFAGTPVGTLVFIGLLSPLLADAEGRSLVVGDGWEYSSPEGTVSYRIERAATYGGLDCSVVVIRVNGQVTWETCVAVDSPLPGHLALFDEDGETLLEMTLAEYRA